MQDPVFKVGQVVRCVNPFPFTMSKGKEYTILYFELGGPIEYAKNGFIFPNYVKVENDVGTVQTCHATRFEEIADDSDHDKTDH